MKKLCIPALFLCLLASPVWAGEKLTLTAPETKPSTTEYEFDRLEMGRTAQSFTVTFVDTTVGQTDVKIKTCSVSGAEATTLMSQLNTANLATKSLRRRATEWAQTKGCLGAGTISGAAD